MDGSVGPEAAFNADIPEWGIHNKHAVRAHGNGFIVVPKWFVSFISLFIAGTRGLLLDRCLAGKERQLQTNRLGG